MSFEFGCARELYINKRHPRLLCGQEDIADLRRKVRGGNGRAIMDALRRKARGLAGVVKESPDVEGLLTHHNARTDPRGGGVLDSLADIALVGVIDGDADLINATRTALAAIPGAEKRGPRDTYSAGYASWGNIQMAYDLAYEFMSGKERKDFAVWASDISVRETLKALRKGAFLECAGKPLCKGAFLRCAGMNVLVAGMMSATLSLMAIEEDEGVPDLSREKAELLRYFEATMHSVMGPNGYPTEDIGYGSGMVSLLARVAEVLRRAGLYDAYKECPRFLQFGRAMLHFVQPWGKVLSTTGDYGADFGWRSPIFPRLAAVTNDRALLWLHGTLSYPIACSGPMDMKKRKKDFPELVLKPGFQVPVDAYSLLTLDDLRQPLHPSKAKVPTQFMDPSRGIATFRSSWDENATFVVFDGSQRPAGAQGHAHDSGGHFSLSAVGEYFAIDTGRYNIEQDQHNVVLVDGKSGQSTDGQWRMSWYQSVLTGYEPGEFVDTASVNNSQASNCYWSKRYIGLVKSRGRDDVPSYVWTVDDVNFANDFREFWWTLNTHPDNVIELNKDHAVIKGCYRGNLLDVHFALPDPSEYAKPHRLRLSRNTQLCGSYNYIKNARKHARDYKRMVGNPEFGPVFARPRLVAKIAGYNGRFMAVMLPRMKGEKPATVARIESVDNSLAVRIRFDDVEDTIIFAYEHNLLEAVPNQGGIGIKGRGEWCVVRASRETGKVIDYAMGHGTSLSVNGRDMNVREPIT